MFKESLKLGDFKKVYPLSLLSATFLFLAGFCLYRGNENDTAMIISLVGFFVAAILFLFFYTAQAQVIGNHLLAEIQEEEPATVKETLKNWKDYAFPSIGVLALGALMYQLIIPLVGSIAGGLFQVNLLGFELNLLTFSLNMAVIVWVMFGVAEINTIGVSFKDTFSYTINFVFTNFRKVVLYVVVYILMMYLFILFSVLTVGDMQMMLLPVKAILAAYLMSFLNVYATNLFIDNVSDDDFVEPEEELEGGEADEEDPDVEVK